MSSEQWAPVAGFLGLYEVSTYGRVRSVERTARCVHHLTRQEFTRRVRARVMRLQDGSNGYLGVSLCRDGRSVRFLVHRLVAEAFIGNPDGLPEVNHRDADKRNNVVSNLEWCTAAENKRHAHTVGSRATGAAHHFARLPRDRNGYCRKANHPIEIEVVK